MHALALVAFYLGVVLYVATATLFFVDLARRDRASPRAEWALRLLGASAVCHFAHIVATSLFTGVCPIFSVEFALSLSAFAAVVVFLAWRHSEPIGPLGAFIAPLALAFMIGAQVVAKGPWLGEYSRGVLAVHVTSSLVGLSMFLLAGGASVFYLIAERRLKSKRLAAAAGRLPPLDVLDRVEHRFLLAGFPLLTIGIISAMFFGASGGAATGPEVARTLLAYGSWVLVALVLLMRRIAGWRGRKAAYGTLAGVTFMIMVIAVYLGAMGTGGGS